MYVESQQRQLLRRVVSVAITQAIDELMAEEVEDLFTFSAALIIAALESVTHSNLRLSPVITENFNESELRQADELLREFIKARSSD